MSTHSPGTITQLLARWNEGDENALEQLTLLVYDELHRLAATYLRKERRQHTLQPTALVNELYLKIFGQQRTTWRNRAQFFGVAAQLMRRILVDHARAHYTSKRGSGRFSVSLDKIWAFGAQPDADLLVLDRSLQRLEELDLNQARIVELRFFGGLTIRETAEVMHVSHATVEREWKIAKAFLKSEITRSVSTTTQEAKPAVALTVDEKKLSKAWSNRELLTTLMSESWAGLKLLVRLRLSPYITLRELAASFEIEADTVNSLLSRLEEFGALEKQGAVLTLTNRGRVILENFEKGIGNSLTE